MTARSRLCRAAVGATLLATVAWLIAIAAPQVVLSTDARYSLAWGALLLDGRLPEFGVADVPTKHPLPIAIAALLSTLGPRAAADGYAVMAVVAFAALLLAVFRLARAAGGPGAGALAALLVATRPRIDFFAMHAFIDIPFAALVLLAAGSLAERSAGAWRGALVLLALAGMLRPEAWLLSGLVLGWLVVRQRRATPIAAVALAASAPALWLAIDLVATGDVLHSLVGTRASAALLERTTGLGELVPTLRDGFGTLIGLPLAAAGVVVAAWALRSPQRLLGRERRAQLTAAALAFAATAGFAVLVAAGLPLNDRYLLVAAVALVALAGAGLGCLSGEGRATIRSSPVAAVGPVLVVAALATGIAGTLGEARHDVRETASMLALAREKVAADGDLERLLARTDVRRGISACPRLGASGSARAAVAALLDRDPSDVSISRSPLPAPGRAVISTSRSLSATDLPVVRSGEWAFVDGCPRRHRLTAATPSQLWGTIGGASTAGRIGRSDSSKLSKSAPGAPPVGGPPLSAIRKTSSATSSRGRLFWNSITSFSIV